MPTLAPSSMSATASAADAITLLNGLAGSMSLDAFGYVCLTIQSVMHRGDLRVVLLQHHRVPVAVHARSARRSSSTDAPH